MAKKVTFKPDSEGIGAFTRGSEMARVVRRSGDAIAKRAGPQFEADTWVSPVQGTSVSGSSSPPRVVSGVHVKPGKFLGGSRAMERVQAAREAGRV